MHPVIAITTEEIARSHSVTDALPHLVGMLIVLLTLCLLWGLTVLLSRLVAWIQSRAALAQPAGLPAAVGKVRTPAPAPAVEGVPPEVVAAISAALATIYGGPRRIISLKPMNPSWEKAGRQSILSSHRIR